MIANTGAPLGECASLWPSPKGRFRPHGNNLILWIFPLDSKKFCPCCVRRLSRVIATQIWKCWIRQDDSYALRRRLLHPQRPKSWAISSVSLVCSRPNLWRKSSAPSLWQICRFMWMMRSFLNLYSNMLAILSGMFIVPYVIVLFVVFRMRCRVNYDLESGQSKGFGFIDLEDHTQVDNALVKLQSLQINGRKLKCEIAMVSWECSFAVVSHPFSTYFFAS